MKADRFLAAALALTLLACPISCGPKVTHSPRSSLVRRDIGAYLNKRGVVLAFRDPDGQPGIGERFSALLHAALLHGGPFSQIGYHPEGIWFGLQSPPAAEMSTAAAIASDLGFDVAIIGAVEKFAFSRSADSVLIVSVYLLDTVSGEVLHAERLTSSGIAARLPPLWEPGLSQSPEVEALLKEAAVEIVERLIRLETADEEAEEDEP